MKLSHFLEHTVKKEMYREIAVNIASNNPISASLALFSFSEVVGGVSRIIHGELEEVAFGPNQSARNFEEILKNMGKPYEKVDFRLVYRVIRGGIVHSYFIRKPASIVMNPDDPYGILDYGLKCSFSMDSDRIMFNVNQFFKDFKRAVNKVKREVKKFNLEDYEVFSHWANYRLNLSLDIK